MKLRYLFAVIFISACCFSAAAQIKNIPTVDVTGVAEIKVVPDEVTFSLRVSKSDKSLQVAKIQNDSNVSRIIELAKRFGIASQDVKTDFILVKEKFDRIKQKGDIEYTEVFAGYTISKTVVVKLRDIGKFENFFSEIIKIGITEVSRVSFESSQLRKYKDQARAMAIKAAREKATALAAEIGQTIGKAISIEEENVDGFVSRGANYSSNSFSTDGEDDEEETFAAGTISVKAQVKVSFLLN